VVSHAHIEFVAGLHVSAGAEVFHRRPGRRLLVNNIATERVPPI